MHRMVASLIVSVALLSIGAPAHAYSGNLTPSSRAGDYTAYYDGAYGPFYNGYWTASNEYYYATAPGHPFVRDDEKHFRRLMITGFHPVEGFGPGLLVGGAAGAQSLIGSIAPTDVTR